MALLGAYMAGLRKTVAPEMMQSLLGNLKKIPEGIETALQQEKEIKEFAIYVVNILV